jgi:hypothetical protein
MVRLLVAAQRSFVCGTAMRGRTGSAILVMLSIVP